MRGIGRFLASVLIVTGALLIADVVVTLLWQEPVSALIAHREQSRLSGQLRTLERLSAADERALARVRRGRLAALARREQARVRPGHALGRIRLPSLGRSYVLVQGTDSASLRKGPGHYPDTALPGEPGTVAVAGHRTTYLAPFRTIDQLHAGDPIVLQMPYGTFTYRVQESRVVLPTALWVTRNVGYQRLVLSACHPLYSASHRIVVFARLTAPIDPESRDSSSSTSATSSASATTSTASQ
ncbi:MAG TPA: sortase [Thermoleophilaceae bacterium]